MMEKNPSYHRQIESLTFILTFSPDIEADRKPDWGQVVFRHAPTHIRLVSDETKQLKKCKSCARVGGNGLVSVTNV